MPADVPTRTTGVVRPQAGDHRPLSRWTVLWACAGLAAAMGVGRFVYTPILPLMQEQAGVSHGATAVVATMNYLGYFLGALALGVRPGWAQSRLLFRLSLFVLVASEVVMPLSSDPALWSLMRLIAGAASAVVFVCCATAVAGRPSPGLAYAGVGVGIAASGLMVALLQDHLSWAALWFASGALTAVFSAAAWRLTPAGARPHHSSDRGGASAHRADWSLLIACYFLEGLGYIILGTFMVAAVAAGGAAWSGPWAWVLVGIAAAPSPLLWAAARRRGSPEALLALALVLQTVSALLPALVGGTLAAAASAVLFGGTFMGITMLAMISGNDLHLPRSAAVLTAAYGLGQVIGPVAVAPLLSGGYQSAFIAAALVLGAAALLAALIHRRRGRRSLDQPTPEE